MTSPQATGDGRQATADHRPTAAAVVPPAPARSAARAPTPRVVWEAGAGRMLRVMANDWADGTAPTYDVQAAHGSSWFAEGDGTLWVPATGEECWAMLMVLAAAVDERTHAGQHP